jgi:hypothetical protein
MSPASSAPPVSIARISLFLVPVVLSAIAAIAAAGYAVGGFLEVLREARATSSALGEETERVSSGAERVSLRAEDLSRGSHRMEASLRRLRASRARLSVLLAAWADARSALAGLVFVPRK